MKDGTVKKFILVCLVIMTVISLFLTVEKYYWRYWPFAPIIVCPVIKVLNPDKKVQAGTEMIYEVSYDKKMEVSCTVKRQLFNGYRIDYDPVFPPSKPLGSGKVVSSIDIPSGADAKQWRMRWTIECPVGPEKRIISITRESEPFQVISNKSIGPKGEQGKQGVPGKNFWGK